MSEKNLGNTCANTATKNVKDIQFWGNGDTFKLISKASSQNEGWMKSTKAMEVEGGGVFVQVTTQQRNLDGTYAVAEALAFAPNCVIGEKCGVAENGLQTNEVVGRWIQYLDPNKASYNIQFDDMIRDKMEIINAMGNWEQFIINDREYFKLENVESIMGSKKFLLTFEYVEMASCETPLKIKNFYNSEEHILLKSQNGECVIWVKREK